MAKPQQPDVDVDTGPVPEDNVPGHHPDHEQDKPSGADFVRKLHEHAQQVDERGDEPEPTVAGEALRATAAALRKVREALPDG
ncbi:MAG: hypothetical protein QOD30_1999 [Actinomycetota bacterium]|jgi:hypothetical protein|nr:hypothetical protein [Actinomycetota bacterium]